MPPATHGAPGRHARQESSARTAAGPAASGRTAARRAERSGRRRTRCTRLPEAPREARPGGSGGIRPGGRRRLKALGVHALPLGVFSASRSRSFRSPPASTSQTRGGHSLSHRLSRPGSAAPPGSSRRPLRSPGLPERGVTSTSPGPTHHAEGLAGPGAVTGARRSHRGRNNSSGKKQDCRGLVKGLNHTAAIQPDAFLCIT